MAETTFTTSKEKAPPTNKSNLQRRGKKTKENAGVLCVGSETRILGKRENSWKVLKSDVGGELKKKNNKVYRYGKK